MYGIGLVGEIIKACKRILVFAPSVQKTSRAELVADLQSICGKCEDSYAKLLQRLAPVKAAYGNPRVLAGELRGFAADEAIRQAFKPDHLCGEIDTLLGRLSSNVDPLKYSVNLTGLGAMRKVLRRVGDFDGALRHEYDEFTRELDAIADQLEGAQRPDSERWVEYVRALVTETTGQLSDALDDLHRAKTALLAAATGSRLDLQRMSMPANKRLQPTAPVKRKRRG